MCEYCGCQALDAIADLTAEHDLVIELGRQVRGALKGGDLGRAAERVRAITAVLGPHTEVEEDALFPAMAAEFPDHVEALRGEHRVIKDVLAEAAHGTPTDPAWPARVEQVLHLLREHILKEQDGVFPAALAVLGPDQWNAMDMVRARVGKGSRAAV